MPKNGIVLLALMIFLISLLTACGTETSEIEDIGTKTFELENVNRILLRDCDSGKLIEITEDDKVQKMVRFFTDNGFEKGELVDRSGGSYIFGFYHDDNEVESIGVLNESKITYDGYYYDTTGNVIDISYLAELFEEMADETKTFELENISKIVLKSGTSGETIEITDDEEIQTVVQFFADNEFEKYEYNDYSVGWSYSLEFYQDDNQVEHILVAGKGTLSYEGYFYDAAGEVIDTEYLDKLLSTQQ